MSFCEFYWTSINIMVWVFLNGHFGHYFWLTKSTDYMNMSMISKSPRSSLIFKNPKKAEYATNWFEAGGSFCVGKIPLQHIFVNKCNYFSFSMHVFFYFDLLMTCSLTLLQCSMNRKRSTPRISHTIVIQENLAIFQQLRIGRF